ncbi:microspherule protein 1-like protein [Euroglyphus maynei]|uniref:Microspherule protein 1-like protein n=1 Tax=Euroglyphus maynei TaxID=6958 RepID=A0A1Y3B8R4_EURMA|nr:microspherule protein 1-like protein [Euroglyphus maynei]
MSSNSNTLMNIGKNDETPSGSNNLKTIIPAAVLQHTVQHDSSFDDNCPRRRASSRSIKRKKFDDELVDSTSTSYPKHQKPESGGGVGYTETIVTAHHESSTPSTPTASAAATTIISSKRHSSKPSSSSIQLSSITTIPEKKKKNKKRSIVTSQYVEENNFWKPTDDFALIINVEQTNDLRKVHDGIKFSSKFTYSDIEQRWRSLLYDKNVKNLALAAIRQLHSDIVQSIESRALFSDAEEELLKKLESRKEPTLESLQELIDLNAEVFLSSRTPKILLKQWRLLRHYNLLEDQSLQPLPRHESVVSFSDIENTIKKELQEELKNNELSTNAAAESTELMRQEIAHSVRKSMLEIRMLENELPKFQILLDSITGVAPSDFDNNTYAVLRGRLVRYLMRSTEITIGRITQDFVVDVDLSLEGPSTKISRLQAVINFQSTGEFIIFNTGKRPIYIDSKPLISQSSLQIHHNSLIEFSSLKFLFLINQDLILKMRNEVLQSCK